MKNGKSILYRSILSAVMAGAIAPMCVTSVSAEELGVIKVESTTIDDLYKSKKNEASNIGIISGEEVDMAHTQSVQEMLQRIPGVTTEIQSGDSLKIHIRGIENQRYMGEKPGVAVVIDGVPVYERTGRVNIDMDNIESIKVIKGGASYLFGDDALSGAVIITTKRGAKYKGYTLAGEVGSFGYKKGLARAGFSTERFDGHIQASRRDVDGYYDDSASRSDYVNGKLQFYIDDSSDIILGMEQSDRMKNSHGSVKGVIAAKIDPKSTDVLSYNDYANHYEVELEKYFATYSKDFSENSNLMVNVYSFGDDTRFKSRPDRTDPTQYTYSNDYQQEQTGLKAEFRSSGGRIAWMAGLDLRENTYENDTSALIDIWGFGRFGPTLENLAGDALSDDQTDESMRAVYGEMKFHVSDPLVVTLNARADRIEYDYSSDIGALDLSKRFSVKSGRLGLNYSLSPDTDLYGNVSTGFRVPSVTQMFVGDIDPTGSTDSNPNLDPERAVNKEIGIRTRTDLFGMDSNIDVAVFQIDHDDYIMKTSGQYGTNGGTTNDIYDNIGGVRNRGLELAIDSIVTPKWSWNLAYTYLDAEFTEYDNFNLALGNPYSRTVPCAAMTNPGRNNCVQSYDLKGNEVPRTSNHVVNLAVRFKPTESWTITGEMNAKSSYYADELNWLDMSGHTSFNLLLNYDKKIGESDWSFFGRVDNLFDKEYYNTARSHGDSKTVDSDGDGVYDTYDGVFDKEDLSLVVNQGMTFTVGMSVRF